MISDWSSGFWKNQAGLSPPADLVVEFSWSAANGVASSNDMASRAQPKHAAAGPLRNDMKNVPIGSSETRLVLKMLTAVAS